MASILESLGQYIRPAEVQQIADRIDAEPSRTRDAIAALLPTLLAALAGNTEQPEGRRSLDSALQRDHDGSLLDHLGSLFGGGDDSPPVPDRAVAGGSILDHILGRKQEPVAEAVSRGSGLSSAQVMKLMMMLAPLVLAYLGRKKRQENLSPEQIGDELQRERADVRSSGGLMGRFFDQDGDGDFDAMDMIKFGASKIFGGR